MFANPRSAFGFYYTQAVLRSDFDKLDGPVEKEAALLRAAVMEARPAAVHTLDAADLRAQSHAALAGCHDEEKCFVPARVQAEQPAG